VSDELMELPEGWDWTSFEELAEMIPNALKAGPFGSALKKSFYVPNGYKIYGQEQVINEDPHFGNYYIDETRYEELKSCAVKPGDILISLVGTIGKVLILPEGIEPGIINPRLVKLSLDRILVNNEYVKKYLESPSVRDYLSKLSHGGTMDILNLSILKTLKISLPPLNEQKRIVAAIEALRERSQKARSVLAAIPELCDKFRQSVLAAAFRGDLTADWREQNPDVEPASALLERIRTARFRNWERNEHRKALIKGTHSENIKGRKYTEPGLSVDTSIETISPKSWLLVSVDQITFLVTDGKHGDCQDEPNSGYFFLSVKDLYEGSLHYENARQIQKQDFQEVHYRTNLEIGDVLVTNAGTIGRVAVAKDLDKVSRTTFQKSIAILKPVKEVVMFEYLAMYIENSVSHLNKQSSGTAVKNLLLRDLKAFIIALPSLEEQSEIVCRVKGLLAFANRLESSYQDAYTRFDYLDRSILAKAFRGELVEQDPNDEPASVLLERIRVDREQQMQGKIKKPGKKKRTGD